jgi:hypothetical protein
MNREQRRQWRRNVLRYADLTPAQKLVLLALEGFADYPAGTNARPGIEALAIACGLKERVVRLALERGVDLRLIQQTARANPKAGRAAVYRLLSTGTTMPLENDFNRHETDFNRHESVISTGTLVPPTNTAPSHYTNNSSSAPAPIDLDAAVALDAAITAGQIIKQQIGGRYPKSVRAKLGAQAAQLIIDGTPPDVIAEALQRWDTKPDVGPGILPWLVSDVIKSQNGHTTRSTTDERVAQTQALKAKFRTPPELTP